LFPFGFGLSYSDFEMRMLSVSAEGGRLTASVAVRNLGPAPGAAIPQFYLAGPAAPIRLAGWSRLDLKPGEEKVARIVVDPRLLAHFDEGARLWRIEKGDYRLSAGFNSASLPLAARFPLAAADLPP
jgi:beta-glucosidase